MCYWCETRKTCLMCGKPLPTQNAPSSCTCELPCSALALAKQFHEIYERLAPSFGYETRPDTRDFDPDSANGRLMVAVCQEIIEQNPTAHTPHVSGGSVPTVVGRSK